jgi:hypothetical protein
VGAPVEVIETGEPRPLAGDEVLLEVMAAGVGNWDEFIRVGGWDVGAVPPMALGVEAAGTVADGGRLATITSDPPAGQRGITVDSVYVRPDGQQLRGLATRFGDGQLEIPVAASYRLADAARALAQAQAQPVVATLAC